MSKAYSNKALPAGTILREWRLEEVLGVGGFGIVYKGRGIYFDELVAIKEYFPSSISERDEEDTVVPIDSDAEEVHALGLKKFVEEAKLLWNLSTPSRHPNIVSVRSLFEIHGTAYMVMDFEDGTSLSRLLKDGNRFNERSLWDIIRPIAEGLERAHRVGVLHRDIKPPNILITPEGRPVLIDFGSARFDTAEATSTKVTFHTPPYAAMEQYVKTYEQGPWTDIYALGVVLYECVTGTKPPEVLERLHGGLGEPLAGGKWPGYGKAFLAAIDSAMTIKPSDRPQSISEWLGQFDETRGDVGDPDEEDEKTRFYAHEVAAVEIVPVAPPADIANLDALPTQVPDKPSDVEFKHAGLDTSPSRKRTGSKDEEVAGSAKPAADSGKAQAKEPTADKTKTPAAARKSPSRAVVLGGAAAAAAAVAVLGWSFLGGPAKTPPADAVHAAPDAAAAATAGDATDADGLVAAVTDLSNQGRTAGAPATAVDALQTAAGQMAQEQQTLHAMQRNPAQSGAAAAQSLKISRLGTTAAKAFAAAIMQNAEARSQGLSTAIPWASAAAGNSGRQFNAEQRRLSGALKARFDSLRSAAGAADAATEPAQALAAARDVLGNYQALLSTMAAAAQVKVSEAPKTAAVRMPSVSTQANSSLAATAKSKASARTNAAAAPATSSEGVSPAKMSQFNSIVAEGRALAKQVRKADHGPNAELARNYDKYLVTLKDSMRGVTSDAEAASLIKHASETRAYLQFLARQIH